MSGRALAASCAAASIALAGMVPAAMATVARALDLAELAAGADRIVVAEVVSVASAWDGARRNIHTTIELTVRERWKVEVPGNGRLTLRQLGGTVGDVEMSVLGSARFVPGESALFFLRRSQVFGMAQGKRALRWDTSARRWLVQPPDASETMTVTGARGRPLALPPPVETLDSVRTRVTRLLEK